jgi:hypothetical protein
MKIRACLAELHTAPDKKNQLRSKICQLNTTSSGSSTVDCSKKTVEQAPTPWFSCSTHMDHDWKFCTKHFTGSGIHGGTAPQWNYFTAALELFLQSWSSSKHALKRWISNFLQDEKYMFSFIFFVKIHVCWGVHARAYPSPDSAAANLSQTD